MQQQHAREDDAAAVSFSSAIATDEGDTTCGQEAPKARDHKSSSSSKYQVTDVEAQPSSSPARERPHPDTNAGDGSDSDSDEFHDSESDVGANYTVVKKSVFKEPRRGGGLLSRLKDASSLRGSSSHARNKYLPTIESVCGAAAPSVVTPQQLHARRRRCADDAPQIVIAAPTSGDDAELQDAAQALSAAAEGYEDDGAGITVAIENAASDEAIARAKAEEEATAEAAIAVQHQAQEDHEAHCGEGPQVVIHSGESDSDSAGGFATLNPVISTSSSRKYRASTISVASVTSSSALSGGCSQSASTATSATTPAPCLQEIPALVVDASPVNGGMRGDASRFLLVINALGASALAKVEKFGTQSTFLELRVCASHASTPSADAAVAGSVSVMKTALHKKSGSDAQWNQQFSAPLRSKHMQCLHIAVKTSSKVVIGEASVSLANIGEADRDGGSDGLFYDQHYAIYRSTGGSDDVDTADAGDSAASGLVHLQLKIVDAASASSHTATKLVPRLQLPLTATPSRIGQYDQHHVTKQPELPAALRNGALLFKVPYHTFSLGSAVIRRQWVMVAQSMTDSGLEISWCDPTASASDRKSARSLDLRLVTEVREGHRTKAFERQLQQLSGSSSSVIQERDKCFSLVTKARTLDLVASCKEEARVWVSALRELLFSQSSSSNADTNSSARVMESYKTSALSPRSVCAPQQDLNKPQSSSTNSRAKLAAWRNTIFDLARKNRIQEAAACLQDGCPIDLLEPGDGDTVLMIACRLGHVQLVELCLSWRAKNDPHPEFGETALQAAVNSSHAECVTLLLSTAAKSDMDSEIVNHIDSNNDAPLHVAARHGDLACLQLLLHHGADICVVEEFGRTPLHCAVANGHLDCVAYLLDVGGDSVLNAGDHDGDTALHYAALAGNEAIVKLLLESAANVFSANAQNETPYDIALREKQQGCAFLISQYYLTNTKEPRDVVASPVSRNEAASTLLLRQRKQQLADDKGDEETGGHVHEDEYENEELECGSDSDASTAYAASHSPQHSGHESSHLSSAAPPPKFIVDHQVEDHEVYEEYRREYDDSPSSTRECDAHHYDHHRQYASIATSRLALSPSAQVREALLRNQSLRQDAPASSDVRYYSDSRPVHERYLDMERGSQRPFAYYSTREGTPRYLHASSARGAFTERLDRDHHHHRQGLRGHDPIRSLQFQYAIQRGAVHELHPYEDDHESHHNYQSTMATHRHPQHAYHHSLAAARNRSQSGEMRYGSAHAHAQQHQYQHPDEWRRWDDTRSDSTSLQYSQGARRSNSVDLSAHRGYENAPEVHTGWDTESPRHQPVLSSQLGQSHLQQQISSPATRAINPLWETFYTQDGYAYYVHRVTGVSQWEQPTAPPQAPPPPPTPAKTLSQQSNNELDTILSPDAIIRMRLAEARRSQQSSSNLNGSAPGLSAPTPALVSSLEPAAPVSHEPVAHQEDSSPPSPAILNPPQAVPANTGSDTNAQPHKSHSDPALPLPPAPEATPVVSPPASPRRESKFQERTGLQLSVDISSPTRQDGTPRLHLVDLCVLCMGFAKANLCDFHPFRRNPTGIRAVAARQEPQEEHCDEPARLAHLRVRRQLPKGT